MSAAKTIETKDQGSMWPATGRGRPAAGLEFRYPKVHWARDERTLCGRDASAMILADGGPDCGRCVALKGDRA